MAVGEEAGVFIPRCRDCQQHYEFDETEPGRRPTDDAGPTRPRGHPGEVGKGDVA